MSNMKKYIIPALVAVFALSVNSCNVADKFQYGQEGILITGSEATPIAPERIVADEIPISYSFSVSSTGLVQKDTKVNLVFDPSAVTKFNEKNGTSYVAVPEEHLTLSESYATIQKGKASSTPVTVTLNANSFMEDGVNYVIPVSISSVEGDMSVIEASKSIIIKLGKSQLNPALDINNTTVYSTGFFNNDLELNNWTLEIKAYPYNLKKRGNDNLCRFCCWAEHNGGQVLLRFNENGKPWKTLDIVSVTGRYVTGTTGEGDNEVGAFEENQWYLITITFNGSDMKVYINGKLDTPWENTISGSQAFKLNKFEIGMSYQGYGSAQSYNGRMSEVRVWNYARTQSEIAETLCSVDPASEGLLGYWRMNEGKGHVFNDTATWTEDGKEKTKFNHLDWSKSQRQITGETYSPTPEAGNAVAWAKDDNNKCLQ